MPNQSDDGGKEMASPFFPEEIKRGPGVLNKRRRKYYLPARNLEIESATAGERNIRGEIRTRLENTILDFPILAEHMENRDLEQILEIPKTEMEKRLGLDRENGSGFRFERLVISTSDRFAFGNPILEDSLIEMQRFIFRLIASKGISVENYIERVIPESYRRFNPDDTVSLDVTTESRKTVVERAQKKHEGGKELTREEKAVLFDNMVDE